MHSSTWPTTARCSSFEQRKRSYNGSKHLEGSSIPPWSFDKVSQPPTLEIALTVTDDQTGLSAFASSSIPAEEQLISCPFDLAITSPQASKAICSVAGLDEQALEGWNDRMRIVTYLLLHVMYQAFGQR